MFKKLTAHLEMVGESYTQHMLVAFFTGVKLQLAVCGQFVHAVFPFIDPPFGTDVRSLVKYLEMKLPENRGRSGE